MARGLCDNTLLDRVKQAYESNLAKRVTELQPPVDKPSDGDGPSHIGVIGDLPFDFDAVESVAEYHARRIAMAGPSPFIVHLMQEDTFGEGKKEEARCLPGESHESIKRAVTPIEMDRGRMIGRERVIPTLNEWGLSDIRKERSWDASSQRSEASDWGTLPSEGRQTPPSFAEEVATDAPADGELVAADGSPMNILNVS
jgi:hypothetical protein